LITPLAKAQQAVNFGGPEGGKIEWSFTWADASSMPALPEPQPAADDANKASGGVNLVGPTRAERDPNLLPLMLVFGGQRQHDPCGGHTMSDSHAIMSHAANLGLSSSRWRIMKSVTTATARSTIR
jgi:hypothetical protein